MSDELDFMSEIPQVDLRPSSVPYFIVFGLLCAACVDLWIFWEVKEGHWEAAQIMPYVMLFTLLEFQTTVALWFYMYHVGLRSARLLKTWGNMLELMSVFFFMFKPGFDWLMRLFRSWFPQRPAPASFWGQWTARWNTRHNRRTGQPPTPAGGNSASNVPNNVQAQLDALKNEVSMQRSVISKLMLEKAQQQTQRVKTEVKKDASGSQAGGKQ